MAGKNNAAPVIIKRKKITGGGGHHGGAWKVAYADFVTAMMAFFLLMWLLGATTEKQRKGVADYFNPNISLTRASAGGEDVLHGENMFSDKLEAKSGTGIAGGRTPGEDGELAAAKEDVDRRLTAFGGESMTMEMAVRHIVTRVTDEGLVIEVVDLEDVPLFPAESADPSPVLQPLARMLAETLAITRNGIAVNGHVRAYPIVLRRNPAWDLSAQRAQVMRGLLEKAGLPSHRLRRIAGHADRKPVTADPMALRNNRLEIVLLRRDR